MTVIESFWVMSWDKQLGVAGSLASIMFLVLAVIEGSAGWVLYRRLRKSQRDIDERIKRLPASIRRGRKI